MKSVLKNGSKSVTDSFLLCQLNTAISPVLMLAII